MKRNCPSKKITGKINSKAGSLKKTNKMINSYKPD